MKDINVDSDLKTNQELKTRRFRIETRCKKHKHSAVTNTFGVTWCKDCGILMKN